MTTNSFWMIWLFLGTVFSFSYSTQATPVKIAAFNVRIFGQSKMGKTDVINTLIKIMDRYDIILVQEIRDSKETAFPKFVTLLNEKHPSTEFKFTISERLGRSSSKEQYAFLYRQSKVTLTDTFQYNDASDVFEREPYAARFTVDGPTVRDFAIVGIHIKPTDAVKEISALTSVYDALNQHWSLEDILIAGDLNADCNYVSDDDWPNISLRTDSRFKWLISDDVDTTVTSTDCTYDRFVAAGSLLQSAIIPNSGSIFKFDIEFGLTSKQAEAVSDHYPVVLTLNGNEDTCHGATEISLVPTNICWEARVCSNGFLQPGVFECKFGELFDVTKGRCVSENIVDCGGRIAR